MVYPVDSVTCTLKNWNQNISNCKLYKIVSKVRSTINVEFLRPDLVDVVLIETSTRILFQTDHVVLSKWNEKKNEQNKNSK